MGKETWSWEWDVFSHFFAAKTLWPAHSLVNPNMGLLASPGWEDLSVLGVTNASVFSMGTVMSAPEWSYTFTYPSESSGVL